MDGAWQSMRIKSEGADSEPGWGLLTTATEPWALYLFSRTRTGCSKTICWVFIVLHALRILTALAVHSYQGPAPSSSCPRLVCLLPP